MSGCFSPDRRKVLQVGIWLAVGGNTMMISSRLIHVFCYGNRDKSGISQRILPTSRQSYSIVGQRYFRTAPEEMRLDFLVKAILPAGNERKRLPSYENERSLNKTVQIQINDDFRNHRMVNVDGWLLSITEARLCGLIALT